MSELKGGDRDLPRDVFDSELFGDFNGVDNGMHANLEGHGRQRYNTIW